ncbi:MAG: four helix bundle protein [Thermodesulfobacteriota bacterium]|jgi:four helix bundle protein
MKEIVPKLPDSEKYDLKDQLSRAFKSIPRLIAEGYAKRHQRAGFQKYIDDAMAECNNMVVSLSQCRDIYPSYVSRRRCDELIDIYDKSGSQLYKLGDSWTNFKKSDLNGRW